MTAPVFVDGDAVSLRSMEASDLDFFHEHVNDSRVWRGLLPRRPTTERAERAFFESVDEGDDLHFAVYADDEPVGTVSVEDVDTAWGVGELGYWVAPDERGQGYATEAVSLAVTHAFDHLRLEHLTAPVFADNEPSRRLLESLGFEQEGLLREHAYVDGERVDVVVYGVLADEWEGE